jgi:ubiquinone/menaquinone biosynthesis C-methylase UbiE
MPRPRQHVDPKPRDSYPGDTVTVQDPPPSNMGSGDAFDEEKGIKAPPGARGEYTERPRGNMGGPGGSIGVDPTKFKVDYDDYYKRQQIPPMFLPAASREIEDEDEPRNDPRHFAIHLFERGLLASQAGMPDALVFEALDNDRNESLIVPTLQVERVEGKGSEARGDLEVSMVGMRTRWNPGGNPSYENVTFHVFALPMTNRATIEPEYAEQFQQAQGWYTDVEVFWHQERTGKILLFHRERSFKDEASAIQDFDTQVSALAGQNFRAFIQRVKGLGGRLATRTAEEDEAPEEDFEQALVRPKVTPTPPPPVPPPAPATPTVPTPPTAPPTPGTGLGFKDFFSQVTRGEFGMSDVPWEPLLPLEGLEDYAEQYTQAAGNFASHIAKSIPAFQEVQLKTGNAVAKTLPAGSRVLDIGASEGNWGKAISAASKGGVQTVSLDPNPDMKNTFDTRSNIPGASYEMKSFGTGFDDPVLGPVEALPARGEFDVVHEAMTFQFISNERDQQIAEMKRHLKPGGVAMLEEKVFSDAWEQNERKKDTEYKSRYFAPAALAEKDKMVGFQQTKNETGAVGMLDNMVSQQALEQSLTSHFAYVIQYWDSGNFKGYAASDDMGRLRALVDGLGDTQTAFSTVQTPRMVTPTRRAFNVYPVPAQPRQMDERLLLQIPRDVQERYSDLHRRVSEYVRNIKLNALDMYSFPSDPPEKWVEEERGNVQVDWEDRDAWASYMGRLSHDDVADWVGLESFDDERLTGLAPRLREQHALETGGTQDFNSWFRSRRPAIEDREFLNYVKDSARTFPAHGLGKGYSGYWRRRNHEQVREIATQRARGRHDRYLREVDYANHVKPNYKKSFDDIVRARSERMPLSDVVSSLHSMPHEGEERETVDGFRSEFDGIVNEGVHALDLHREPISRDDRLYGDMEYQGEKWVPTRRIADRCDGKDSSSVVVSLYQYGDRYFLAHPSDRQHINPEALMVRAQVYRITPGSSIVKHASVDWDRKARTLAAAINEIKRGANKEAVFTKYGREFGPGLRKTVSDYMFVTSNKKGDGGAGPPGSSFGDSTCSSFEQQTPDNCKGCTFSPNMGGNEFGYGDGACLLTHLFLNAPEGGFGRGDTRPSNPDRTIGTPGTHPQKPRA